MALSYRVEHVIETASTNDDLKRRAKQGAPEGLVLVANRQTGGRGRLGRSFFSPEGCGLYASVLLRPRIPLSDVSRITCYVAVVLWRAVREQARGDVGIKWVNDIYRDGKKVCGILTESAADADGMASYAVVGFGVNLNPPRDGFPPEIAGTAGSVYDDACCFRERRDAMLSRVLEGLSDYERALADGGFTDEYRAASVLDRTPVAVCLGGVCRDAVALGVDACGRLHVRYSDGEEARLRAGDVSIRIRSEAGQ